MARKDGVMYGEIGDIGYLKISNEADRATVANILFRNGYTVQTKRRKKNGKTYEYYVHYEMRNAETTES